MLTNYLMRFFDLATIYLEAEPPAFADAATVIGRSAASLDGVGDRLGEHEPLLREARSDRRRWCSSRSSAAGADRASRSVPGRGIDRSCRLRPYVPGTG